MSTFPHHAADLTPAQAILYLREMKRLKTHCPCEHGHLDCATFDGGPCTDEVLNTYPELA